MIDRERINFLKQNGYHKYPMTMQMEITRECPFNCPQCYKIELGTMHMDFNLLKKMITDGIRNGVSLFVLNGGEPLLYPHFIDALKLFKGVDNVSINCFSSGYGLTDEIIEAIKETTQLRFYISLNGSTDEVNSTSRQGYNVSINAIEKLKAHDCPFGVNWVARKDNVHDFENMIKFCRDNKVMQFSVTSNKLAEKKSKICQPIDDGDIKHIARLIKENPDVNITSESCFPQLTAEFRKLTEYDGCAAGYSNVNISIDGEFLPCTHLYYPEKFDSLEEYWEKSVVLKRLRSCGRCTNCNKNCRHCKAMSVESYNNFGEGIVSCRETTEEFKEGEAS